ncbi:MAG: hypothetical protein ACE5H3_01670 [Planctomycetota bacterium]
MSRLAPFALIFASALLPAAGLPAAPQEAASNGGTLQGRVHFPDNKVPKGFLLSDSVLYLKGRGLEEAMAPSKGLPAASKGEAAQKVYLDQVDITFTPHILPVVKGTEILIRNNDSILHNIHTQSRKNKAFNRAQAPNMKLPVTFKKTEVIHVGCDIHSQMSAYIIVVPNSFFTKAAKDGSFQIPGVPAGKYELVCWHEGLKQVSVEVEVAAGRATEADVEFGKPIHSAVN